MNNNPFMPKLNEPDPKKEQIKEVVSEKLNINTNATKTVETTTQNQTTPTVLLSSTDVYIYDRMKSQPKDLESVDLKVEEKHVPGRHRLSLPEELSLYEKKYTFKWLFKRKQAIDEACDIKGWVLVNKTYFPDLPNHLFTANGSMERGDAILAFMPREKAEAIRRKPGELSRNAIKTRFESHKDDPNYYVPKDEDSERVVGI